MTALIASFITLTLAGIINASYLAWQHYHKKPLICPLNHKCDVVTESKWSNIFPVRNEILGILFYTTLLILSLIYIINLEYSPIIKKVIFIITGSGLIFSIILTWIQSKIIKDYCFYCIISAIISLLLFINTFAI